MCPPAAVYDMDFQQMVAFHRAKNADVTIAMHPVSSLQADDWGLAAWAEVISCPVLAASQQPAKLACTVRRHADQSIQACITDVLQVPECDARSKGIAQVHTSSCEWPADGLPWRGRVQAIAIAALPKGFSTCPSMCLATTALAGLQILLCLLHRGPRLTPS